MPNNLPPLHVTLDELLPVKQASRELPKALDRLGRGETEKYVLTRRGKPRAVLLSVTHFQTLQLRAQKERDGR
jgi:PHD/YefM family antitoxin component YafN of YafNO toxin-antitoxin module